MSASNARAKSTCFARKLRLRAERASGCVASFVRAAAVTAAARRSGAAARGAHAQPLITARVAAVGCLPDFPARRRLGLDQARNPNYAACVRTRLPRHDTPRWWVVRPYAAHVASGHSCRQLWLTLASGAQGAGANEASFLQRSTTRCAAAAGAPATHLLEVSRAGGRTRPRALLERAGSR